MVSQFPEQQSESTKHELFSGKHSGTVVEVVISGMVVVERVGVVS